MQTILITGGTGMLGTELTTLLLNSGYKVIILSRSKRKSTTPGLSYALWDVGSQTIDERAISDADYIVHLAGANLGKGRWTTKRKKLFIDSRVRSAELLVKSLERISNRVKAVISASAIGYYGADEQGPGRPFEETDKPDDHFLGDLVQKWESAIQTVNSLDKRLVVFRFGVMLSNTGGAFPEFRMPLKFGINSVLGNGRQVVSWIHIDDAARLIQYAIQNPLRGNYNGVTPHPVTNKTLMKTIAKYFGRLYLNIRVPALALKILYGEKSIEVLKSAHVNSTKIQNEGFQFLYPDIESAIQQLADS